MAQRLPTVTITSPQPNAVVGQQPFAVTGLITASNVESVSIQSVSVQIDSQTPIQATVKQLPDNQKQSVWTFNATVQITSGQDPHLITVSVASDAGNPVVSPVTVTVGPRLVAPSAWVDLKILVPDLDPTSVAKHLNGLLGTIAQRIAGLSLVQDILDMNMMVVGPNIVPLANPPTLRVGFWIVEDTFAPEDLIQPTADFPLPQMTPEAAAGSFNLVQVLPFQVSPFPPDSLPIFEFALAVPTATVQLIVDALLPTLNKAASRHGFTLNSITVQQPNSTDSLVAEVSVSYAGVGLSGTVTETLGTQKRVGTESNMPTVLKSSLSSGLLDALSVIIPILGPVWIGLIADAVTSAEENNLAGKVYTSIGEVLDLLPAWIPFRNSIFTSASGPGGTGPDRNPNKYQLEYPFPMGVLNFSLFGTNDNGIIGAGTGSLANRDQSMVVVKLVGPSSFSNYSPGNEGAYGLALTAFEPDNDQMQLTGVGNPSNVDIDPFSQEGSFSTTFPISSGSGTFNLLVSGTETCAVGPLWDPPRRLLGSASLAVTVKVSKDHQQDAKPAPRAAATAGRRRTRL